MTSDHKGKYPASGQPTLILPKQAITLNKENSSLRRTGKEVPILNLKTVTKYSSNEAPFSQAALISQKVVKRRDDLSCASSRSSKLIIPKVVKAD
jgi:hypothetical protein